MCDTQVAREHRTREIGENDTSRKKAYIASEKKENQHRTHEILFLDGY